MIAARNNYSNTVKLLLDHNANKTLKNKVILHLINCFNVLL